MATLPKAKDPEAMALSAIEDALQIMDNPDSKDASAAAKPAEQDPRPASDKAASGSTACASTVAPSPGFDTPGGPIRRQPSMTGGLHAHNP